MCEVRRDDPRGLLFALWTARTLSTRCHAEPVSRARPPLRRAPPPIRPQAPHLPSAGAQRRACPLQTSPREPGPATPANEATRALHSAAAAAFAALYLAPHAMSKRSQSEPPLSAHGIGLSRFLMYVPYLICGRRGEGRDERRRATDGRESWAHDDDERGRERRAGLARARARASSAARGARAGDGAAVAGADLLAVVVLVRVVAHEDEAHVEGDEGDERVRDLLPLVRLSCGAADKFRAGRC